MTESNRLNNIPLINFDASTLTGTYQAINAGLPDPLVSFKMYNSSANLVFISNDGINDHDFVPPGGTFIFDSEANADGWGDGNGGHKEVPQGRIWYAKTSSNTDRLIVVGYH